MARSNGRRERDAAAIASDLDLLAPVSVPAVLLVSVDPVISVPDVVLPEIEDNRLWTPSPPGGQVLRAPRATGGMSAALVDGVRFASPDTVLVCARRHRRREVLFALRKTGKGARSKRRRNSYSNTRC